MNNQFNLAFENIVCLENLLAAWEEFIVGKSKKPDVEQFSFRLMDNIFELHRELVSKTYRHSEYKAFNICDPKPRNIHKAAVRDRLVHHAVYRILYPFFDKVFISHSYSCRLNKGTHKALNCFKKFSGKASCNNTKTCWVLKCDIKKFFASVDQLILISILSQYIPQKDILWLIQEIVHSFHSTAQGIGLPLGNLTSQLLVNIYLNEFDQFVKHRLKAKYYLRYADDFVFLSRDEKWLESLISPVADFLQSRLRLSLHPQKVYIKTLSSGVDFLGWVHFADHRVLRTTTKKRMFKKIRISPKPASIASYLGLLKHGNAYKLKRQLPELPPDS